MLSTSDFDLMLEYVKAYIFVRHIHEHLKMYGENVEVECEMCGETIDQIWNEYQKDRKLRNRTV